MHMMNKFNFNIYYFIWYLLLILILLKKYKAYIF